MSAVLPNSAQVNQLLIMTADLAGGAADCAAESCFVRQHIITLAFSWSWK